MHRQRSNRKILIGMNLVKQSFIDLAEALAPADRLQSPPRGVDWQPVTPCDHAKPSNVVAVLVGDQQRVHVLCRVIALVHAGFHPLAADPAVDHHMRGLIADTDTVAARPARD